MLCNIVNNNLRGYYYYYIYNNHKDTTLMMYIQYTFQVKRSEKILSSTDLLNQIIKCI